MTHNILVRFNLVILFGLAIASQPVLAEKYKLDEAHSTVGFKIKHLVIATVNGKFTQYEGGFDFDQKNKSLKDVAIKIQAASIDTGEKDRDKHLRSKDFFDVENNPTLTFTGKKTVFDGEKPVQILGDLTIRKKTQPVTLAVEYKGSVKDPWGNNRLAFSASARIKRSDFGLNWNKALESGGLLVGEDVEIVIDGEALPANTGK